MALVYFVVSTYASKINVEDHEVDHDVELALPYYLDVYDSPIDPT